MHIIESDKEIHSPEIQSARENITRDAQFDKAFIVMNALASVIACFALLADSTSGVIGAMLVAMLLGPIAGLSLSLVDGDYTLFKQSSVSLLGGVGIVVICALIIGLLLADIPASKEMLARTQPNYLDLMIALAGGAVGAYAVISPRILNAVVGVAIATALVPPLCTGTLFIARGDWDNAFGAYLLAFTNIIAIQFASSAALWLAGYHKAIDHFYSNKKIIWLNGISLVLLITLSVILGANTKVVIAEIIYETNIRNVLTSEIDNYSGAHVSEVRIAQGNTKNIVRAVVRSPQSFTAKDVAMIESKLPKPPNGLPIELRLRLIKIEVMTKDGLIFDPGMALLSQKESTDEKP